MLMMYITENLPMHRTQLYFDETMFEQVKQRARGLGLSVSAYIREAVKNQLAHEQAFVAPLDLSTYSGMWKDREITQQSLREQAWK